MASMVRGCRAGSRGTPAVRDTLAPMPSPPVDRRARASAWLRRWHQLLPVFGAEFIVLIGFGALHAGAAAVHRGPGHRPGAAGPHHRGLAHRQAPLRADLRLVGRPPPAQAADGRGHPRAGGGERVAPLGHGLLGAVRPALHRRCRRGGLRPCGQGHDHRCHEGRRAWRGLRLLRRLPDRWLRGGSGHRRRRRLALRRLCLPLHRHRPALGRGRDRAHGLALAPAAPRR